MRIVFGLVYIPLYLGWLVYRILIRRDLKQHMDDFYGLTFFIAIWTVILAAIFL